MSITHECIRPETTWTHGRKIGPDENVLQPVQWCCSCRAWVFTQPEPSEAAAAKLAPKIAHYLKHGHDKEAR